MTHSFAQPGEGYYNAACDLIGRKASIFEKVMLVGENSILLLPAIVIIAREVLISALREWMASKGLRDTVAVAFSGKLKTTFQMIAIIILIIVTGTTPDWMLWAGYLMIYIAALLSLYSALHYFKAARPHLFPDQ